MSSGLPPSGTKLAALHELPNGGAVPLDFIDGEARFSLLLHRRGGVVQAYENRCPHAGFPLERLDGTVISDADLIVCAAHGASFSALDGACLGGPGRGRGLTPVPVCVRGNEVLLA